MIEFFDFDPSTPLFLGATFFEGDGGWGLRRGQNSFVYCGCWTSIRTHVLNNFCCVHGPPNEWRGPGSEHQVPPTPPWVLATKDLAVFRLACRPVHGKTPHTPLSAYPTSMG